LLPSAALYVHFSLTDCYLYILIRHLIIRPSSPSRTTQNSSPSGKFPVSLTARTTANTWYGSTRDSLRRTRRSCSSSKSGMTYCSLLDLWQLQVRHQARRSKTLLLPSQMARTKNMWMPQALSHRRCIQKGRQAETRLTAVREGLRGRSASREARYACAVLL
jgi:hypothetical protein